MKVAIMQPYFLPYIGYFQLIGSVDVFVVYDNIKYTKSGWINRNRYLLNGMDAVFTLPLKKDSDSRMVVERSLAADFDRRKLLVQFTYAYRRAPFFEQCIPLVSRVLLHEDDNLFGFIHHSIREICDWLEIGTRIVVSSAIAIDHGLRGQDKVIALCAALGADTYINSIGGVELYAREAFKARGLALSFLKARPLEYAQLGNSFLPWLSIIDVMMFNPRDAVMEWVAGNYELL